MISGSEIREVRKRRKLKQYEVAEQAGLAVSILSKMENSASLDHFTWGSIRKVIGVLDVGIDRAGLIE